jgi:hypothetical protein
MDEAANSNGFLIRSDQAAIVVDTDGRVSLLLPRQDPDAHVSPALRLLLAIALRMDDPEWIEELLGAGSRPRKIGFLP